MFSLESPLLEAILVIRIASSWGNSNDYTQHTIKFFMEDQNSILNMLQVLHLRKPRVLNPLGSIHLYGSKWAYFAWITKMPNLVLL